MAIVLFPQIAGVKVESSWGQRGLVRCTIRLTRPLTPREAERLAEMADVDRSRSCLSYVCRPEAVEEREELVRGALASIGTGPDRFARADSGRRRKSVGSRCSSPSRTPVP